MTKKINPYDLNDVAKNMPKKRLPKIVRSDDPYNCGPKTRIK